MKLTVVIVNYNVKEYIGQCLDSLRKALYGIESEVYVVDNCSKDGSVEYIKQYFKKVNVIELRQNLGFARANNIAIRSSTGEYVLMLNPDTFVPENTIKDVLAFADTKENIGAVGVKMYNSTGTPAMESRRGLPTPLTAFYKMCGLQKSFPRSRRFGKYYMSYLDWDVPAKIEVVSGAFCLVRRAALERAGLLDTDFFMYGEDIDLSYRLMENGCENWYVPCPILHYKGESTQKTSFKYVHVFYDAMLIFFRKHYGHLSWIIVLPVKLAIYLKALLALVVMATRWLRGSLGFVEKLAAEPKYVFVGRKMMTEHCRSIARRVGLLAEYYPLRVASDVESVTITKGKGVTYVVYDTSLFSYGKIIEMLSANAGLDIRLGTYNRRTRTIITPDDIIS